jgi:hypothetical protein
MTSTLLPDLAKWETARDRARIAKLLEAIDTQLACKLEGWERAQLEEERDVLREEVQR